LERTELSQIGSPAIAGRGKLGSITNPGDGVVKPQGKGGGKEEGTETHPFEASVGLGEVGKVVAGGEQYGGGGWHWGSTPVREMAQGEWGFSFRGLWGNYL
jgi:hypothetical protein